MMQPGETLLVATRNRGKTEEFRAAFAALGVIVKDLNEALADLPPIVEDGETFADNALIKARTVSEATGLAVLADDSGLCVAALGGEPGVYSARFAGEDATDAENNAKLLRELRALQGSSSEGQAEGGEGEPRTLSEARFVSALVLYKPGGEITQAEGYVSGFILDEARGDGGFGYDPLFWLPAYGKSMAQLQVAEKNAISHRGEALKQLLAHLG